MAPTRPPTRQCELGSTSCTSAQASLLLALSSSHPGLDSGPGEQEVLCMSEAHMLLSSGLPFCDSSRLLLTCHQRPAAHITWLCLAPAARADLPDAS